MIYAYKCDKCGRDVDIVKPHEQSHIPEKCPSCETWLRKLITVPTMSVPQFEPAYYHAFGKEMHTRGQVKEELHRIKGETGKELVEVGNDSLSSVKPERKKVDLEAAGRELTRRMKDG